MANSNQPGGFSQEEEEWIKAQREREEKRQKRAAARGDDDEGAVNINSLMDIMVIMLVFLLKSYGEDPMTIVDDDVKAPQSTSQLTPEDGLTIAVKRTEVHINDDPVLTLTEDGRINPDDLDGDLYIEEMVETLNEAVESQREQAELAGEEFEHEANIIADQTTPHMVMLQVLQTAAQAAEIDQFRFAVVQTTGEVVGGVDDGVDPDQF